MREQFGPYRVLEEISGGGLSRVYRVERPHPDMPGRTQQLALKTLLHYDLADEEVQQRFKREVSVLTAIHHRNVCGCIDWGLVDSTPYLVLELLEGRELDAVIAADAPMPYPIVHRLTRQLLDGLEALHSAGVVHRQLAPGNVVVTQDGVAKVINFSLARKLNSAVLTHTGQAFGFGDYASPEMMSDAKRADARADLYSLGVMVYQMLSGHLPAEASQPQERLSMVLAGELTPLSTWCPELPAAVTRWVHILTARDANRRYPNAAAARHALPDPDSTVHN
ncbi:MAG: serine/threonine-protein kinase [Candidatus Xenobia bacterium]